MAQTRPSPKGANGKDAVALLTDEGMKPGDDHYDAKVTVLGEYIDHHVKEEQDDMFPKAKKAKVDMAQLGERMAKRKEHGKPHRRLRADRRLRDAALVARNGSIDGSGRGSIPRPASRRCSAHRARE